MTARMSYANVPERTYTLTMSEGFQTSLRRPRTSLQTRTAVRSCTRTSAANTAPTAKSRIALHRAGGRTRRGASKAMSNGVRSATCVRVKQVTSAFHTWEKLASGSKTQEWGGASLPRARRRRLANRDRPRLGEVLSELARASARRRGHAREPRAQSRRPTRGTERTKTRRFLCTRGTRRRRRGLGGSQAPHPKLIEWRTSVIALALEQDVLIERAAPQGAHYKYKYK